MWVFEFRSFVFLVLLSFTFGMFFFFFAFQISILFFWNSIWPNVWEEICNFNIFDEQTIKKREEDRRKRNVCKFNVMLEEISVKTVQIYLSLYVSRVKFLYQMCTHIIFSNWLRQVNNLFINMNPVSTINVTNNRCADD